MSNGRMQFEYGLGRARAPRREEEAPFRLLVLADLSGGRAAAADQPVRVDIDNLDQVLARHAPRLDLALGGARHATEFRRLDDFHPDTLFRALPLFAKLRQLRGELADPAQFRRAAAALGEPAAGETPLPAGGAGEVAGDIERLLGRTPQAAPSPAPALDDWIRRLVAPHVVADTARDQQRLIAAVDAATGEEMRRVLHHPAFQALEATWRGIARLVYGIEDGERVQVFLLDLSHELLAQDLAAGDLARSALHGHLCGRETQAPDGEPWSLLIADFAFGPKAEDVALLAALGALAARAGAPLLARARIEMLGCASVEDLAEPAAWRPADAESEARWLALRTSSGAASLGLALPRVLLRLPYGAKTDPIDSFAFEELPATRDHEAYLWGSPAFSLGLIAAQAFTEEGWEMDLVGRLEITDLPAHSYREGGETRLKPCAEVLLGESAAEAVAARGIMPLMSYRSRNAARLLRWQSLAQPVQPLQGAWS